MANQRCAECGGMLGPVDRYLTHHYDKVICYANLKAQLAQAQERIAELSGRAQSAAKMLTEDAIEALHGGYSGTARDIAKLAAYLLERDSREVYREVHALWKQETAEEQQPTTGTGEEE